MIGIFLKIKDGDGFLLRVCLRPSCVLNLVHFGDRHSAFGIVDHTNTQDATSIVVDHATRFDGPNTVAAKYVPDNVLNFGIS